MTGRIEVDTEGLTADGRQLAAAGDRIKRTGCAAPAGDPISMDVAFLLIRHEEAISEMLDYAQRVREHGGAVVESTAAMFTVLDRNNALMFDRVTVTHDAKLPQSTTGVPGMPYLPPKPGGYRIPSIPQPNTGVPPLTGEQFAEELDSGPGSNSVRNLSRDWLDHGFELEELGDDVRSIGDRIDRDWFDGEHNAAKNVRTHGKWLQSMAKWAARLSTGADGVADAFDTAVDNCPRPAEFDHAKNELRHQIDLNRKMFGFNAGGVEEAAAELSRLQTRAVDAMLVYLGSATGAVTDIGDPVVPCPLIAEKAVIPNELTGGPGTWTAERRGGSERSRAYESRVSGSPDGMEYELPRGDGEPGYTDFDGFDPGSGAAGLLIEAKGPGYDWMVGADGNLKPNLNVAVSIPRQLELQYDAALAAGGVPVEWRVAEPRFAEAIERIIAANQYDDLITVVTVPAG
ncbi:PPE domain-containing protein [Mycolicibacterium arenosum]|uniref:Restriction endonuclease fold toxin 5 domain-containing protein n=1 Tax=Mycolicibacterium arenosum TaxID=2952157 RepID=A0ABT1MCM0_9MYCO|nr:PPE domain-containing protein [Mycolicibacterium sp. CAU 1645]MCP9276919.1 restriction endonuclease fold toxin 5 domain-containing protein [Mycolicibacterium sp. CAU 1645]